MQIDEMRSLHQRATDVVVRLVDGIDPDALGVPTPCEGWDLRALLAHMTGQDRGFAAATRADADAAAYAPLSDAHGLVAAHHDAAAALVAAFAAADPDRPIWLAEFRRSVPLVAAVGFHLLDTAVHGWDVAASAGLAVSYDDEVDLAVLDQAQRVPAGAVREAPGAPFAPVLDGDGAAGPFERALLLLGRDPAWRPQRLSA